MKSDSPASRLLFGLWCSFCTIVGGTILTWKEAQALNGPIIQLPLPLQVYIASATLMGGVIGATVGISVGMAVVPVRRRSKQFGPEG